MLVLLVLFCLTAVQCQAPIRDELPSIIFITIDTIRADHLGCYGYSRDTSPVIDEFAEQGILFERALVPMATTLPSHVSLMTSTNPIRHGVHSNFGLVNTRLVPSANLATAAQILGRLGYATAGFISASPLKRHSGIDAGFEVYDEPEDKRRNAEATTDQALDWLSTSKERPVFLWIHYFDPHQPYDPPPPFHETFEGDPALLDFLRRKGVSNLDPSIEEANNLYDGEIRYVDGQIARLLEGLRANGLYDDSAIVLTGDHGEGLGQHEWIGHGRIYNEQLEVPLIVKLPDEMNRPGERRREIVSLIDVLPSLVSVLDLPLLPAERAQFDGLDVLGRTPEKQYVLSERVRRGRIWESGFKYSLTSLEWKYFLLTEGDDQLFDMTLDRIETRNVIEEHPEIAAKMKGVLVDELDKYQALEVPGREETPVSESIREQLRGLGYVE